MKSIHQVRIAFYGAVGGSVNVLGPGGRPHEDDVLLIVGADGLDDGLCVGLDVLPLGAAVWLVADLVEDILVVSIFFCHFLKEGYRLFFVLVGVVVAQDMPVDDDIHAEIRGVFYSFMDQAFKLLLAAAGTVAVIFFRVHGKADAVDAPVVPERLEGIGVYVFWKPVDAVGTDTFERDDLALAVDEGRFFYFEPPVFLKRCQGFGLFGRRGSRGISRNGKKECHRDKKAKEP